MNGTVQDWAILVTEGLTPYRSLTSLVDKLKNELRTPLGSKYAQNLRQDASGLTLITTRKIKPTSVKLVQIHEFQEMMKGLYFKRDSERGIDGTYNWLVDEVAELGEELKGNDKEATEKEFADVIAWLASLANIMGIDLEKAALTKYNDKCPKCQGSPCQCTF